ncbi:MAG TPA: ABC transporter substrate-binding protein [Verrucomicrobiae bacterium]|jgi:peptide/nickel transport system substrate-binding protein|nr:ABC transporter substrate-binding protein [Verrucomicrobiae bacterium]
MKSRDGFEEVRRELREGSWVEDPVTRRAVLQTLGLGALGMAGLAAGAPGHAEAQAVKRGGTIKIGSFQNIDTLDAHNTTFITACGIHNNIYNGLLKIVSPDGKGVDFKPELAREWEIQGDRTHIFRLNKGVTFHNGDPCTAADIKWNLERVKDKQQAPIHAWKVELLESIEMPDSHTVKLSFAKPYPFLRVAFTGSTGRAGTVLSPRAVKEKGKAYGRNPVGTGPFKFVEWKEGDYILLERYASYWEKDAAGGALPYLDKVQIKFIIEPSTLVAALKTGEVDGVNSVSPQFMADLRKDPKLNAMSAVGGNWRCLHMNMAKEPFADKNLRKAVAFALDRQEILSRVEFGEGIIAHGPISPPMGVFYDAAFESGKNGQYYDIEQAKALMKQSKHASGAEVMLLSGNAGTAPRQAEVVQAQLAKIGVKVNIELADAPTFRRRWLQERQWDLVQVQWDADLDPDETLYPELHSTEAWNAGKWVNKDFDKMVEAARAENDFKKRKKYYEESVRMIVEDAPVAILMHLNEFKVFGKHVKGFQMIPAGLINMHQVWLDKA